MIEVNLHKHTVPKSIKEVTSSTNIRLRGTQLGHKEHMRTYAIDKCDLMWLLLPPNNKLYVMREIVCLYMCVLCAKWMQRGIYLSDLLFFLYF